VLALKFFTVWNILVTFTIFEQLALALKNSVPWNFSLYWIYIFIIQDFWATCACPAKQFALKLFTVLNIIFIIQDFWATCACPEKQSCPEISHCIEILFIIQDFWTTCACLEKQSVPWNFSLYWNILYHSRFLSNLRLPWKFSSQGGGRPPWPSASYAYA